MAGAVHAHKEAEERRKDAVTARALAAPVARTPVLTVGHAFDPAEAEADSIADDVIAQLRSGEPDAHRHTAACDHGVRRSTSGGSGGFGAEVGMAGGALSSGLSDAIESRRGRGSALPTGVRRRMESAFGRDLGDVSIHTDSSAAQLSTAVSARAFTTGRDIFFGAGEFRPDTPAGEHMLAHELAHTTQQGAGIGRKTIHRLWDIKAPSVGLHRATVRAFPERNVYFMVDADGDEVVVKSEDQPVGLGQLIGSMQKKVGGVNNLEQRKLTDGERKEVDLAIEVSEVGGFYTSSWDKRGDYLKKHKGADPAAQSAEVAFQDAHAAMADKTRNLMVMEFAEGESAKAKTKETIAGPNGKKLSPLRSIYADKNHLKQLGEMTAIDLFMGNLDRFYNGNIENWFYNPAGFITVLDNVDPGSPLTGEMTVPNMNQPQMWHQDQRGGPELSKKKLAETAGICLKQTLVQAEAASDDKDLWTWWNAKDAEGEKRRKEATAAVVSGLEAGKKRIVKIFTSTRFTLGGGKSRAMKKSIKADAGAAAATDADDSKMGAATRNYYEVLKARAKWLDKN